VVMLLISGNILMRIALTIVERIHIQNSFF
jgi:hypothetical protein